MEDFKPTEQQLKSLNLFAYYVQSNGCSEATCDLYFYEDGNQLETHDLKYWHCKGGGVRIETYESINEVLEKIFNEIDITSYLEGGDDESRGSIELSLDCKEKTLDLKLFETVRTNNETGATREVNEDFPELLEFYEMLRQRGVKLGRVEFDGGGDQGEIYDKLEVTEGKHQETIIKTDRNVEDFLYGWLEDFYGGWEINEGSHGEFIFDVEGNTIDLVFYEHAENSEDRGKILHIEF